VKLQELATQALDELRSLIFELRPPDLETDGLCGALRKHVDVLRRLQPTQIELKGDLELAPDLRRDQDVFRIAQEALQNALRHAHATHILLRLRAEDGRLLLDVEDDGVGFDPDAADVRSQRLGLTSMEERAQRLGARLEVRSAQGAGTTVHLEMPRA
jgi:signal transduction histidine kinase